MSGSANSTSAKRTTTRSPWLVRLGGGVLALSLLLATALLLVDHFRPTAHPYHPAHPLTDQQAMAQVIEPAREIVAIAQLRGATGGYLLMSCRDLHDPPYQGALYVTFELPTGAAGNALRYLQNMAQKLVANGWAQGLPPNQHEFGHTLTKNGVTAIFYRNADQVDVGTMQIYGECRDMTDHATDPAGWTDITPSLIHA